MLFVDLCLVVGLFVRVVISLIVYWFRVSCCCYDCSILMFIWIDNGLCRGLVHLFGGCDFGCGGYDTCWGVLVTFAFGVVLWW